MFDCHYVYVVSYKGEDKKFKLRCKALQYVEERMERQESFAITITVQAVTNKEYQTL